MLKVTTWDGLPYWKRGTLRGENAAVIKVHLLCQPCPDPIGPTLTDKKLYGRMPAKRREHALRRKDAFIDLVAELWPDYEILRDTEPEPFSQEGRPGRFY